MLNVKKRIGFYIIINITSRLVSIMNKLVFKPVNLIIFMINHTKFIYVNRLSIYSIQNVIILYVNNFIDINIFIKLY